MGLCQNLCKTIMNVSSLSPTNQYSNLYELALAVQIFNLYTKQPRFQTIQRAAPKNAMKYWTRSLSSHINEEDNFWVILLLGKILLRQ